MSCAICVCSYHRASKRGRREGRADSWSSWPHGIFQRGRRAGRREPPVQGPELEMLGSLRTQQGRGRAQGRGVGRAQAHRAARTARTAQASRQTEGSHPQVTCRGGAHSDLRFEWVPPAAHGERGCGGDRLEARAHGQGDHSAQSAGPQRVQRTPPAPSQPPQGVLKDRGCRTIRGQPFWASGQVP